MWAVLLGLHPQVFHELADTLGAVVSLVLFLFAFLAFQISILLAIKISIAVAIVVAGLLSGYIYRGVIHFRNRFDGPHPKPSTRLQVVHTEMEDGKKRVGERKQIQSITGEELIDHELMLVIALMLRDYVEVWYKDITPDTEFVDETRDVLLRLISLLAERCQAIDWFELITKTVVDVFIRHVQLFAGAEELVQTEQLQKKNLS
eukprot:m.119609 g.119609  ORF g.119609 m.119609 type:complete len:204 (+) comp9359_c0_seq6:36-647(+)